MKFVIGDIHGEIDKLQLLIELLKNFHINELIFIGDYIDKGQNSKEVLEYLKELRLQYDCIFLMGNHEYYWLKYLKDNDQKSLNKLIKYGARTTVLDFGLDDFDREKLYENLYMKNTDFFDNLKPYYESTEYIAIHSGIPFKKFNSPIDISSIEEYLTQRYEFISYKKLYNNKKIIFGHTGFISPYYDGFKIGIDTSAVYGYNLTAFCISDDFFINNLGEIVKLDEIDLKSSPVIVRNLPPRYKG